MIVRNREFKTRKKAIVCLKHNRFIIVFRIQKRRLRPTVHFRLKTTLAGHFTMKYQFPSLFGQSCPNIFCYVPIRELAVLTRRETTKIARIIVSNAFPKHIYVYMYAANNATVLQSRKWRASGML